MRILSIFALSALALTATAQSYTITGTADVKAEGKMVYLINQDNMTYADSAVIADGAFKFEGTVADQLLFEINLNKGRRDRTYVIVQPGTQAVVDFTTRPAKATDNGGLTDKMNSVDNAVAVAGNAINEKIRQLQAEGKSQTEMAEILNPEIEKVYDIYRNAIVENKDNMVGAYVLGMVAGQFYPTLEALDEVMAEVKYANKIARIRMEREGHLKAAATQPGKMFVDFTGFTVDGQSSKLSDYVGKGKYVLVDFWASWCGPCKGEIPNLIELQEKYAGEKFTVLGVNVWDEESKFKAALTAEGITYPQIFVPQNNKDNATELYGIKGIPQIILFAPDGTIVKRDLRGQAMKDLVAEEMAK